MGLKLKERTQEVILETKAEHINQRLFALGPAGRHLHIEADLRGSDFSGSDLRAVIFSRAIMPGVNFEGSDMQARFATTSCTEARTSAASSRGRAGRPGRPRRSAT